MNKRFTFLLIHLLCASSIFAQEGLQVSFLVNDTEIDIVKEVVSLNKEAVLKIRFRYDKNLNIEAVKIISYQLAAAKAKKNTNDQQQPQKMSKMKLAEGKEKIVSVNLKNVKDPIIIIPIKEIYLSDLSKLKINILNCKEVSGKNIHRNNKSYEIYMPIYRQMKNAKLISRFFYDQSTALSNYKT